MERKKREEKREEENRSESLQLLSRIFDNQTVDSYRSKSESSYTQRELRVGTRICGFRQNLRGRGFSPTLFNSCQRTIQMVEVFRVGTVDHLSPKKNLGLNTGFS